MGVHQDSTHKPDHVSNSDRSSLSSRSTSMVAALQEHSYYPKNQLKFHQNTIIWPTVALLVPMILISGLLLVIIFKYQVIPESNLFQIAKAPSQEVSHSYILVDFSSTQIAFLADLTSTVAPFLAGSLMSLASVVLFRSLKQPQEQADSSRLPTPHQVSLLIGTLAASYDQLWKSMTYLLSRKRRTAAPPVLWYAATTLFLSIALGITLTAADAVFHTLTNTDDITLYSSTNQPLHDYGRGLNALCANFDRLRRNYAFPCTVQMDSDFIDPNTAAETAEVQYLAHNTSKSMEIRYTSLQDPEDMDLAYLIPKPSNVGPQTDFHATTFGVTAQCNLISPSSCNISHWGEPWPLYTNFNCSENFYGVLGLPPNSTNILQLRQPSPYISFLSSKPQSNLQYSFFSDPDLLNVYNPAGLNDSGYPDPTHFSPLTDAQLTNTIYMALAWRVTPNSFLNSSRNEMVSSNRTSTHMNMVDYFLNCKLQAYEVEYVWFNQSLLSISASTASNGTLMDMWHATNRYATTVAGGGVALQDVNVQATIAGVTIADYESAFGALLSRQILATIGGYTSPRQVLQQQSRQNKILTKVPKAALAVLVGCSLIYPALGLIFLFKAYRTSHEHTQMAPLLSNWGLASSAWNENEYNRRSTLITADAIEACEREEKVRLYITRSSSNDFRFAVYSQQLDQKENSVAFVSTSEDVGVAV